MKRLLRISAVVLIAGAAISAQKNWTGSVSTDWGTDGNWDPSGVPTESDDVIIKETASRDPYVNNDAICLTLAVESGRTLYLNSAGKTLQVNGSVFQINGGASVSFAAAATLNNWGTFNNGGNFDAGSGTVIMHGGTIAGGATTFYNLTISNSNGVGLETPVTVTGTLEFTDGRMGLGSNSLTIGSSGSISGSSSSRYIVTDGTGVLTRNGVGTSDMFFPVGTASAYNPVTINNAGTSDNFSVSVKSGFDHTPNNDNYVNCQWTITEAVGGGSDATITLQWNATDENTGFNRSNQIYIGRWDGSQWVQTSATLGGGGPYTATASNFTSFSPFGVGNDGALPIQMASFAASVVRDNQVEVAWRTVSETNNYGFEIYRKRGEAGEWAKIAFVQGHGTTLAARSYTYLDKSVGLGKYYYQIKQVDLDGKSETYPEMNVVVGVAPGQFVLAQNYPNPFNPSTTIEFALPKETHVKLEVYNMIGQRVATLVDETKPIGIYIVPFDASALAGGTYFYRFSTSEVSSIKKMMMLK